MSAVLNQLIAAIGSQKITATGGTITTVGLYKYHTFTSGGTFAVTGGAGDIDYLVVAGGGGGGGGAED